MTGDKRQITARIYFERGLRAIYSGEYEIAISAFKKALALEGDHFAAHAGLCLACHELDRTSELFEAFEQIPVTDDSLAARLLVMAVAYYADGEYLRALKNIHQSLKLGPIEALSHYVLGRTVLAVRRYKRAIFALRVAHELAPRFIAARNLLDWTDSYLALGEDERPPLLPNAATLLHQPPRTVEDLPKYNIFHDRAARDYLQLTGRFRILED